jgi:hypothetical protein
LPSAILFLQAFDLHITRFELRLSHAGLLFCRIKFGRELLEFHIQIAGAFRVGFAISPKRGIAFPEDVQLIDSFN